MPADGIRARTRVELSPSDIDRFWSKVDKSGECWKWTAAGRGNGYGCMKVSGKVLSAHCIAFQIAHGGIPEGKIVCHSCDNRWCVQPSHLFAGSPLDNVRDMDAKGRSSRVRGEQCGSSRLTEYAVTQVWFLLSLGWSRRRIAMSVGVAPSTVNAVVLGQTWRHVSERIGAFS